MSSGRARRLALALVCLAAIGCRKAPPAPDDLGALPPFELIGTTGQPFGSRALLGRPYVLSTFFTSCRSICPAVMSAVRQLRARAPDLRCVSVTIDPDNDTPAVLEAYGKSYGADGDGWRLLTGDYHAIRALLIGGFKTAVGETPSRTGQAADDIEHSGKLMLVDGRGHLRGWFSSDAAGVEALLDATARL